MLCAVCIHNTRVTTAFTRKYYLEQHKLAMPTAQEAEDAVQFEAQFATTGESSKKKFQSIVGGIDSIGQRSAPKTVRNITIHVMHIQICV
jgi:hypothetical protein